MGYLDDAVEKLQDDPALLMLPPTLREEFQARIYTVLDHMDDCAMDAGASSAECEESHCSSGDCHTYDDCEQNVSDELVEEVNNDLRCMDDYLESASNILAVMKNSIDSALSDIGEAESKRESIYGKMP